MRRNKYFGSTCIVDKHEKFDLHMVRPEFVDEWPDHIIKFLEDRHITKAQIAGFSIIYVKALVTETKTYCDYVGFPCGEGNIELRRVLQNDDPKYITIGTKEKLFESGSSIGGQRFFLVEDIMSAIRLRAWNYGYLGNVVAIRGTNLSPENLLSIAERSTLVDIGLDSDEAGRKASKKLCEKFTLYKSKESITELIPEKDWKWYTDEELRVYFEQSSAP